MEIWKDIPGYEGEYQASNLGSIRSLARTKKIIRNGCEVDMRITSRILKAAIGSKKYLGLNLSSCGFLVHRLIAITFHPNPNNLEQVNHKDGNKLNNRADNLEWVTRQQNIDHGFANGLMHKHKGETHHKAKLRKTDVITIRLNRECFNTPYHILAEFYGVSKQAIMDIFKGKNWIHV